MQIQFGDGREMDIHPGSFVYTKDSSGNDSYQEWSDLSIADQRKFESIVDDLSEKTGG